MTYEQLASAYAQACRQRDMAMSQLADIGAGYAEKMDDFVRIVRCRDCAFCVHDEETGLYQCGTRIGMHKTVKASDFCSYGERR